MGKSDLRYINPKQGLEAIQFLHRYKRSRLSPENSVSDYRSYVYMFQHACALYARRQKQKLKLDVVHVGPHVFLPNNDVLEYENLSELFFHTNGWESESMGDIEDPQELDENDPWANPRAVHWRSSMPLAIPYSKYMDDVDKGFFLQDCLEIVGRQRLNDVPRILQSNQK